MRLANLRGGSWVSRGCQDPVAIAGIERTSGGRTDGGGKL